MHPYTVDVPATVPGTAHDALLAAGVLADGDPVRRFNELSYRWVATEEAWWGDSDSASFTHPELKDSAGVFSTP